MNIPYIIHEAPITVGENIVTNSAKPYAEGILQDLEVVNRNRRCYSTADMKAQLASDRTKELLKTKNMKGENGHPVSTDITRQSTIDPMKVCVRYDDIWLDGNLVMAKFTGTNNQLGREFDSDLLDGELPSFSLRALGSLETTGGKSYVKNLKVITWDRVIYPSHKRAYTTKLLTESAGSVDDNQCVVSESYEGKIIPINNPAVISYIQAESANVNLISDILNFDKKSLSVLENGTVRLYDDTGATLVMNTEKYIRDEIMEWASRRY